LARSFTYLLQDIDAEINGDEDLCLYQSVKQSLTSEFLSNLGAELDASQSRHSYSGRLLLIAILESKALSHVDEFESSDDLLKAKLIDFGGDVSKWAAFKKQKYQLLREIGWTYSNSEHLYALFNNCVVPQAPSRFSYWANGILSKFETLSVADKRLEDHDQALDAAVEEYRRIVKAKKFNTFQKSNHPSDYPPTTDKKFKFNNPPKAGDPLTFTTSSGKIIKWCRIHGWNNSHTLNECRKARSDDQTSKVGGMATLFTDSE